MLFRSHNARLGGVEVRFDARPHPGVTDHLKGHGFRWSGNQGLWYAKHTPSRWDAANNAAAMHNDAGGGAAAPGALPGGAGGAVGSKPLTKPLTENLGRGAVSHRGIKIEKNPGGSNRHGTAWKATGLTPPPGDIYTDYFPWQHTFGNLDSAKDWVDKVHEGTKSGQHSELLKRSGKKVEGEHFVPGDQEAPMSKAMQIEYTLHYERERPGAFGPFVLVHKFAV